MKFNRDIFLTAPLWANWCSLDKWGNIFVYEDKPFPSECGSYWINHDPVAFSIRVGRVETIGDGSTPRLIRKL